MKRLRMDSCRAFTVLELLIVVTVLFVLAAVFLPVMVRPHASHPHINCHNNLKQIGLAFKTWAIDNNDKYPMQVSVTNGGTMELVKEGNVWPHFSVMSNELSTPKVLFCAEETDARRKVANTFTLPPSPGRQLDSRPLTNDGSVSYFVGVDATEERPNMLLSGDCNLVVDGKPVSHGLQSLWTNRTVAWSKPKHQGQGYILLTDGSVQMLNSQSWRSVLTATGVATNRLAMP